VFLVFGDGTIGGSLDNSGSNPRVLRIYGAAAGEHAGSEIWMSRVTASESGGSQPLGDLIICRQDYSGPSKVGTGAMTIIPGQAILKTLAESADGLIDLSQDNSALEITTVVGANAGDRLCMWARTGDLSGDGVDDIAVGADQEDRANDDTTVDDAGAVYLLRGGPHLRNLGTVDLAQLPSAGEPLAGNLLRVRLPLNPYADYTVAGQAVTSPIDKSGASQNDATNFHFGATLNIVELDDNAQAELLVASSLNRAGGVLSPSNEGSSGSLDGTVYIIWGDNFIDTWGVETDLQLDNLPGSLSIIDGADGNRAFGEELLGGLDFNGDGIADLDVSAPHDRPLGRNEAGTLHVMLGKDGSNWPQTMGFNLSNFPSSDAIQVVNYYGAKGSVGNNTWGSLSYRGDAGDIDKDGYADIITNEMVGDGIATNTIDVGN
jgi:hypothetical protein